LYNKICSRSTANGGNEEEMRKLNKTGKPQGINSKETFNSPWGQEGFTSLPSGK
jgi:hypothetical protein